MQKLLSNKTLDELQFFIHDIKSPLTNLGINLETLRNQLKDMPINYEQSINSALRSLDYIKNYVLSYKNDHENNIAWLNAKEEIEYLITNHFETTFNKEAIKFQLYSSGDEQIFGNRLDFRRLIFNLLNNSCEALQILPRRQRRIQLSMINQFKFMTIKIVDNGPGIANCSSVFDLGYTTKQNHAGIGLNLVTQIVSDFNGEVSVTSAPFKATCFQIKLPISDH